MRPPAVALAVVASVSLSAQAAEPPSFNATLDEKPASAEVVRCHFDEGRIVIRINDRLLVLHDNDQVECMGLAVIDIGPNSATLAVREGSAAGRLRIVRITWADDGKIRLSELSTDPNAIRHSGASPATPMGNQRSEPPERSPSDS